MPLWSPRRGWLVSEGKDPVGGPAARLVSTTPEKGVQTPAQREELSGDFGWHRMPFAPSLPGPAAPSVMGHLLGTLALAHPPPPPPPPRSLSCWRKLSQGLGEKHQPHGESAQGKTSPCPPSTPSFSGSSQAANHRRGRTVSPQPRLGKGLPAPRSHSRAGLNGANALSWPTANPSLSF